MCTINVKGSDLLTTIRKRELQKAQEHFQKWVLLYFIGTTHFTSGGFSYLNQNQIIIHTSLVLISQQIKSPDPQALRFGCSSWCRCYGVRAAFFQWLAVIQAGLSCDCLSVPAVQVSGCSAQQVQTGRHMTTLSSQALGSFRFPLLMDRYNQPVFQIW